MAKTSQDDIAAQQSAEAAVENQETDPADTAPPTQDEPADEQTVESPPLEVAPTPPVTMPETPSVETGQGTDEQKQAEEVTGAAGAGGAESAPLTVGNGFSLDGAADLFDALSTAFRAHVDIPNPQDARLLDSAGKYAVWLRAASELGL